MQCKDVLCVYNKGRVCILDQVSINDLAMCEACIHVEVDETLLASEKQRMLEIFDRCDKGCAE